MRDECRTSNRADIWTVFEGCVLTPTLTDAAPAPDVEADDACGFISPSQASTRADDRHPHVPPAFCAVVSEYTKNEREIDSEILDLGRILALPQASTLSPGYIGGMEYKPLTTGNLPGEATAIARLMDLETERATFVERGGP